MCFDATKVPPLTEAEAEAYYESIRPVSRSEVSWALNTIDVPQRIVLSKYIQQLQAERSRLRNRVSELSRVGCKPGDGDMGG